MADPQPSPQPSPWRGFLVSTLLVAATLAFSLGINLGSFRQNYAGTLMAAVAVVGDKAVGNIQEAIGYGKPLDDFYGMEPILRQIVGHLPWVRTVQVALADGRIVQTEDGRVERTMKESVRRRATAELAKRPYWFDQDRAADSYALHVPIRNPDDRALAGFLIIVVDGNAIERHVAAFRDHIVPSLLWTGLGTIALLGLFAFASWVAEGPPTGGRGQRLERGHRLLTLGALVAVQIAAGVESYSLLSAAHLEAAEQATDIVGRMVRDDIETVIHRGVGYVALQGVDAYFDRILSEMPTLRSMVLRADAGALDDPPREQRGLAALEDVTLRWPLAADRSGMALDLVVVVAGDRVARQLTEFGLDMATILITSLLFMFELNRALGSRRTAPAGPSAEAPAAPGVGVSIRFATFLMYFGAFLPVSFVPLVMGTFDQELFGLPPVKAAAAPLTAEMVCGVAAAVAAGHLAGRVGWRALAVAGFAAGAGGMALAAVTGDPLVFVLARGLGGAGTMLGLIGVNSLIGRLRGVADTPALQAGMFAGMYAGVNCGAVSGALLAASNGPTMVFAAGAAIPLLGLLYTAFAIPRLVLPAPVVPAAARPPEKGPADGPGRRWTVAGFLLLISLPTAAAAMFQPFYLPLFVSDLGMSSATVGRAYLMHGLCVVLIGPLLTRLIARRVPVPVVTILSGGMIAGALALFGLQASLWTAFGTVFLIGVAESFGLAAQLRHVETLAPREASRREATLALHVNARKAGQAVGPLLFGTIAAGPAGVGVIGAGLAGSLLLFALLVQRWRAQPEGAS